jgi:Tol biopolymer transport system component
MKKNKILLILALFLFTTQLGVGQKKVSKKQEQDQEQKQKLQEYFNDGDFFFGQEDYREALFNFLKVYQADTMNANINYQVGMCYVNISGEERKAIPYFERALPKISTKYEKNTLEEKRAPLYLLFYLGNAYRTNNQIDRALEVYSTFRKHPFFEGHFNEGIVDNEIAACDRAKIIFDNPVKVKFTNLGPIINNSVVNKRPVVDKEERTLIYLSELKLYDAIMMCRKENGVWGEPENISPQVASDGDCEPTSLSSDGTVLYLVKKTKNNNDIYMSKLVDGKWTAMVALNKNINSSKNESAASISTDGKTLYFSSDRRGSFGKLDIYKSELQAYGDWGTAINLGENINTDGNDTNPFISDDGKVIFFSSEGHLNMGGYDIFSSQLMTNGKWEKSANVGYPINTTSNDLFYYPLQNGEIAYSSNIKPDGFGRDDIYRVENYSLQARNNKPASQKPKTKKIVVRDKVTEEVLGILYFDQVTDSLQIQQASDRIDIKMDK